MPKILFLTPSPIESASERYRIYQFLPYLEHAGYACRVCPFANQALHRAIQSERLLARLLLTPTAYLLRLIELVLDSDCDAAVVHRGIFAFPWPALEKLFIRWKGKVVFDFDDAIYVGHRDSPGAKYSWMYKLKYGPKVNEILSACTHVIGGNRTLAEYALQFNSRVSVIPTVVDLARYTYSPPRASADLLTVGWIGSRSTSPYLLEVEGALRRLGETHRGKIRFLFYGHPERKLRVPNCESLPFSLASEIDHFRSLDIGIMPMPDNQWTRGKCAFKAIQYMALGIPTVASPVGTTCELIQHDETGLLARTEDEWFLHLDRLARDWALRRHISLAARGTIESRYSLQVWGPELPALIGRVLRTNGRVGDAVPAKGLS